MLCLLVALAYADVVDRVVHVVSAGGRGGAPRVVTASDIAFEAALDPFDASPVAAFEDPGYPHEWRVVDHAVVRQLAGDVEVFRPGQDAVERRFVAIRSAFASPEALAAFLGAWGMTEEDLRGWIYARLVVERYVSRALAGGQAYGPWMAELRARAVVRTPAP